MCISILHSQLGTLSGGQSLLNAKNLLSLVYWINQYDICKNTQMVDLLVSLAYSAAEAGVLDEPLPRGLALKVPNIVDGRPVDNSLRDFDSLSIVDMRRSIKDLIDTLPPV